MRGNIDKSRSTDVPTVQFDARGRMVGRRGRSRQQRQFGRHRRPGVDEAGRKQWLKDGRYPIPGTYGVCRLDGVGDIIFMEPALRALKRLHLDKPLVLYTRNHFQPLGKLVGFDETVAQSTQPPPGLISPGKDVCYALERHVGAYALDRVSLWERIFDLPVTTEVVRLTLPDGGQDAIAERPEYDRGKPILFFAPLGIRQRRWSQRLMESVWPLLLREYNVVVASERAIPKGLGVDGAIAFPHCSMQEWFRIVGACDVALSHDTGALYLAGGAGIPTVGTYEQLPPWLRMKRFDTVRGVRLRLPDCRCDHHGPCPNSTRICYDDIDPRKLVRHLNEARAGRYGMWDARTEKRIAPPLVEIIVAGISADERASAKEAAIGLNATLVEQQTGKAKYILQVEHGKPLRGNVLCMAIAQHEYHQNAQNRRPMVGHAGIHVAVSP